MSKPGLEQVIHGLLRKIADANGYGTGKQSLYRPLQGTNYSTVRTLLFPESRLPAFLMGEEQFRRIRAALKLAKGPYGERCLTAADLEKLDWAWQRYRRETLTAPKVIHAHWTMLATKHDITPKRLRSDGDIYWCLHPFLYSPMMQGDVATFNKNNRAFLSGWNNGSAAFPKDSCQRKKIWMVYLIIASFAHHRLGQEQEKLACVYEMKRLLRSGNDRLLALELLGHAYYVKPASTAALRGRRMVEDHGLPAAYEDWNGFDLGRAGISAINLGCDGHAPCRELGGMTPVDAIRQASEMIGENGHTAQSACFAMTAVLPDALRGDIDKVYTDTAAIKKRADQMHGRLSMIDDYHAALRAVAHYQVSQHRTSPMLSGPRVDLEQARLYVDRLGPFFKTIRGIERTKIREIIKVTDQLMA